MKFLAFNINTIKIFIANFNPRWIGSFVKFRPDLKPCYVCGISNQINNNFMTNKGFGSDGNIYRVENDKFVSQWMGLLKAFIRCKVRRLYGLKGGIRGAFLY